MDMQYRAARHAEQQQEARTYAAVMRRKRVKRYSTYEIEVSDTLEESQKGIRRTNLEIQEVSGASFFAKFPYCFTVLLVQKCYTIPAAERD